MLQQHSLRYAYCVASRRQQKQNMPIIITINVVHEVQNKYKHKRKKSKKKSKKN